jgi:hypothetical protein
MSMEELAGFTSNNRGIQRKLMCWFYEGEWLFP